MKLWVEVMEDLPALGRSIPLLCTSITLARSHWSLLKYLGGADNTPAAEENWVRVK